jgi:hypothetical protein
MKVLLFIQVLRYELCNETNLIFGLDHPEASLFW